MADENRSPRPTARQQPPASRAREAGEQLHEGVTGFVRGAVDSARRQIMTNYPVLGATIATLGSQNARVAARDFVEGAVGQPRPAPRAPASVAAPSAAPQPRHARPGEIVGTVLGPGLAAPARITPSDRISAAVDTILRGPFTMRGLATAASALPAPVRPLTPRDNLIAETAAVSKSIADTAIRDAQARAASGEITSEQAQRAVAGALTNWQNRSLALAGANPFQIAQAQQMSGLLGKDQ